MINNGITRFDRNGLELIINESTGECFASQSATARMCNTDEANIRYICTSKKWDRISLEIPTDGGLRSSKLLNEDQIGECLAKYNPDLLAQCLKAGVRVFLYGLAGYSPKPLERLDLKYQVDLACFVLSSAYGGVVEPSRLAIAKCKVIAKIDPLLAGYLEGTESVLPSAPPEDQTFTPTQIGKMLGSNISAQKVNKLLEEHGYQENQPTAKGKVHWVPTELGKPHCVVTLDSKANGDPVENVRWKKSIVDELLEAMQ
jgi:hypothetical protein